MMAQKPRFTPEQKRDVVVTLLTGKVSMAELCRKHQVSSTTIYNWRDAFLEAGSRASRVRGRRNGRRNWNAGS